MKKPLIYFLLLSCWVGLSTASALEYVIWRYDPTAGNEATATGGAEATETPGAFIGSDDPELGNPGINSNWAAMLSNSRLPPNTPLEHVKLTATITAEVATPGVQIVYRFRKNLPEEGFDHTIMGVHVWTVDLAAGTNTFEIRLGDLPAGESEEMLLPLPVEETYFITNIEMSVFGMTSPTVYTVGEFTMSVDLVEAFNVVPAWRIDPFGGLGSISSAINYMRTNNPDTTSDVEHSDFGFVDEVPHNPALADGQFERTTSAFGLDGAAWGMAFFSFTPDHMLRSLPEGLDLDRTFVVININADFEDPEVDSLGGVGVNMIFRGAPPENTDLANYRSSSPWLSIQRGDTRIIQHLSRWTPDGAAGGFEPGQLEQVEQIQYLIGGFVAAARGVYTMNEVMLLIPADDLPPPVEAPPVITPEVLADGTVRLILSGDASTEYTIWASDDLANWESIAVETTGPDGLLVVEDTDAAALPRRFYAVGDANGPAL
ncbi:MAG: hypothetical protein EA425_15815 [Puniceicoccaceae bacterium]|nr:MAG: hypothetical protein EA425_15815 [Puniceicoccaceae bacterium]